MTAATYRIVPAKEGFCIEHDGDRTGAYATREAALEAALGPASNAIKMGYDVTIQVPRNGSKNAN